MMEKKAVKTQAKGSTARKGTVLDQKAAGPQARGSAATCALSPAAAWAVFGKASAPAVLGKKAAADGRRPRGTSASCT